MGIASGLGKIAKGFGMGGEIFSSSKGWSSITDAFSGAVDMVSNAESRINHKFNKMAGGIVDQAVQLDKSGAVRKAADTAIEEADKAGKKLTQSQLWDNVKNSVGDDLIQGLGKDNEVFGKAIEEYTNKGKLRTSVMDSSLSNADRLAAASEFLGNKDGKIGSGNLVAGFFENEQYGKTRKAVVGGAVVGGAVGMRYLSGGNLTTNSRGEHDIAGVPFF